MKDLVKKIFAITVVATMLLATFAGCAGGEKASESTTTSESTSTSESAASTSTTESTEPSTPAGNTDNLNAVGEYPIAKEVIEMNLFAMSAPNVTDLTTNDFTHYMEEKTNIKWNFQTASQDAYEEKINLLMASGDYPDAFLYTTPTPIARYALKEKMILPLDELIPANMPNYWGYMQEHPELLDVQRQADGHLYGVASINNCYHCRFFQKMWVNSRWLKEMGAEVPTTTDEFIEVCKQYIALNPTGVAVTGSETGWGEQFMEFLLGSFITGSSHKVELVISPDKKVVTNTTQEEYREALKFFKELYDIKAIDEATLTQDGGQLSSLMNQPGEPVLFTSYGVLINGIDPSVNPESYANYDAIAPLKGPSGTQIATEYKYAGLVENKFTLSDKCPYPEAALRWADHFYTLEGYLQYQFGDNQEGTDWVLNPEGAVGLNGGKALFDVLNPWTSEPQNHDWQDTGLIFATDEIRLGSATDPTVNPKSADGLELYLYNETKEKMAPYAQKEGEYDVYPALKLTPDEQDSIMTQTVEFENYIKENRVAFVTGEIDIHSDEAWAKYLDDFEAMGLSEFLKTHQDAYDRQYAE